MGISSIKIILTSFELSEFFASAEFVFLQSKMNEK